MSLAPTENGSGIAPSERSDRRGTRACAHCGLETQLDDPGTWYANADDASAETPQVFCCQGCMGAYALIHELGLEDFYSLRGRSPAEVAPVRSVSRNKILEDLDAAGVPVETFSDGLCRVRLGVDGLHCAACTWLIEKMQPSVPGLKSVQVRMSDATVELIYDPKRTHPVEVANRLARFGYGLSPIDHSDAGDAGDQALQREHWMGMAAAFFLAANSMWVGISLYAGEASGMAVAHASFLRWVGALLGLAAAVGPGRLFFRSAWAALRAGVPHVDVPVALGLAVGTLGSLVGAATGRGHVYFDSLAALVFLLRVGRYIQFRAQHRTGLSIAKLLRMHTVAAVRIQADGTRLTVPSYRLEAGDLVEVLPGQIVPGDGVVVDGCSSLQTAFITGESYPVSVQPGALVIGGSANLQSPISLRITAAGEQSRMGRLTDWVRQATAQRTPLIRMADRVGGIFVWCVLGLAVLTFAAWTWSSGWGTATEHTVALLTIACPCALALAAPLVITVALGRGAKENIWIRDGNALERLSKPGILWFDKTGTLTFGHLQVLQWRGTQELLRRAAALESHSEHHAARAIVAYAMSEDPHWNPRQHDVSEVVQVYGRGIQGIVDGARIAIGALEEQVSQHQVIQVQVDGNMQGEFLLGDRERPDAIAALQQLRRRGWLIGLLSGDREPIVRGVASRLEQAGIPLVECLGEQSPEQKLQRILQSREEYPTTVMVGDGVNDAAALVAADVGIAIRGPGEACLKHAPIYIPNNQLDAINRLMDAAQRTVAGIYRCFAVSLLYNAITITLAISGWIHPLVAALFMPLSGISVLVMAMMAKTFPKRKGIR